MPGLRVWGSGLEALTEYYLKYVRRYIVEAGRALQRKQEIDHPTVPKSTYPYDIDLLAVNPAKKEVMLVSCSEKWNKSLEKTLKEFKVYEKFVRDSDELGFGDKIKIIKVVACVNISEKRERELARKGIEVLKFECIIGELLNMLRKKVRMNRKGVHLEPLLWLLLTLDRAGKIKS